MNTLRGHFPANKQKWKLYAGTFLPVVLGSLLFSMNGFVDNFMVGKYDGATALHAANSWTNILKGMLLGVGGAGSVVLAQLYFGKKFERARDVVKLRYIISLALAFILVALAWTIPEELNGMFLKIADDANEVDIAAYERDMEMAVEYMRVIAIQWVLLTIAFNLGNQLREIGHAKVVMLWGIGTLLANITLNSILMYVFDLGVAGAAWASVAGRTVALSTGIWYIKSRKLEIGFNPLTIFSFNVEAFKLIAKRWFVIFFISTTTIFVTFRSSIWADAYPAGSIGVGIGAPAVLAISGTILNIFIVTFNALSTMSARFVGSELGKGNIEQAKINSNEIKGFNTTMAAIMSLMMFIVALFVPYMNFLVSVEPGSTKDVAIQLEQAKYALFIMCLYYPIWIWFTTSYRNGLAGGKGFWFTFADWFITGPIQLSWVFILGIVVAPNIELSFIWAYFWFFSSDLIKLVVKEFLYYKTDWAHSITNEELAAEEVMAVETTEGVVDKVE